MYKLSYYHSWPHLLLFPFVHLFLSIHVYLFPTLTYNQEDKVIYSFEGNSIYHLSFIIWGQLSGTFLRFLPVLVKDNMFSRYSFLNFCLCVMILWQEKIILAFIFITDFMYIFNI